MAAAIMSVKQVCGIFCRQEIIRNFSSTCRRCLATQATAGGTTQPQPQQQDPVEGKKDKWLSNLFVRRIDPGHESHSSKLSDKDVIYELQIHAVKPEFMGTYLNMTKEFVDMMNTKKTGAELVGSWTVDIGDQDEAIHIWKYPGGYPQLGNVTSVYRTDQVI